MGDLRSLISGIPFLGRRDLSSCDHPPKRRVLEEMVAFVEATPRDYRAVAAEVAIRRERCKRCGWTQQVPSPHPRQLISSLTMDSDDFRRFKRDGFHAITPWRRVREERGESHG